MFVKERLVYFFEVIGSGFHSRQKSTVGLPLFQRNECVRFLMYYNEEKKGCSFAHVISDCLSAARRSYVRFFAVTRCGRTL